MPTVSSRRRAEVLLLAITIVWGSTFVITKGLLDLASPLFYCGLRFLLAALMLLVPFYRRCTSLDRSAVVHGSVLGGLLFAGFILQTVGIRTTTASKAAFFTGMLVPLTPVVHAAAQRIFRIRRRPLLAGNILGVVCAALGLWLLTSPEGSGFNAGDAQNLACAFFFAAFIVYLDTVPRGTDSIALTFVQFLVCGSAGMLASVFEDVTVVFAWGGLAAFLYLTIFATVITMWIQNKYQGDTTPARAAVIFAIEPVVAAVFAYFVRGEMIGFAGVAGAGIIVAGLVLSEFSEALPLLRSRIGPAPEDVAA